MIYVVSVHNVVMDISKQKMANSTYNRSGCTPICVVAYICTGLLSLYIYSCSTPLIVWVTYIARVALCCIDHVCGSILEKTIAALSLNPRKMCH